MTLIVNLFGGPGSGKSTTAAQVFSELKLQGIVAELVTEFAKDLTWEGRQAAISCQPYVFGEQLWRIERLIHAGVEVVVSDSPLLLSCLYAPPSLPVEFQGLVEKLVKRQRRTNYFLRRVKKYHPKGWNQTEDEAKTLDGILKNLLHTYREGYFEVDGNPAGAKAIIQAVGECFRGD